MKVLVVPTIREASIKQFLEEWKKHESWDSIIVVEDSPTKTFDIDVDFHYSWKDIDAIFKEDSWIFSRRDSAIRSFGFWKAYLIGADYIFTLDDDCLPIPGVNFIDDHIKNLNQTDRWCDSVLGLRTRGKPYFNLGILNDVKFSVGLWENVPDLDAIHMLAGTESVPLPETRIIPKGQYFPFCGMNFCFKREVAPLTYFPLMGENSPYRRFDDIWFGVICKKICDHLGYHISCGKPYINHSKASNAFDNLIKEAPGVKLNETFWETIDAIKLTATTPKECVSEIGDGLLNDSDEYLKKVGKALKIWSAAFV